MPTVRRYGTRQLGVEALRGGQRTAAETALSEGAGVEQAKAEVGQTIAGLGQGIARLGIVSFSRIQADERERADQVALLNAQNQLDAWEIKTLHDPQTGAFNTRGKDSFTLPETVDADFQKVTGEIEKGLGTPEQKAAFQRLKGQRATNVAVNVRRHVAGEMRQYEAQELQSTLENAVSLAAANSLDPRRIGQEIARGEAAIETMATRQGMSGEAKTQALEKFRSGAHVGVINNLLAQEQEQAAAIYYDEVKGQIDGTRRDELLKAIEIGGRKRQSQKLADDIVAAGGTLTEQRDKARSIEDPDTRDLVMQRIEHENAVSEKAERDAEKADAMQATNIVEQTGRFDAIPAPLLARLEPGLRSSLRSYALQKAKGLPVETNPSVYYGYLQMAANEPDAFAKTNLLANRHQLDESDFKQLASLQLSITNGNRSASEKDLAGFRTKSEILDNTLQQYGIESRPANQSAGEKKAVAQLQRMLDRRLEAAQAGGQKVTNVEIQQTIDELLGQTKDVPGSFWQMWGQQKKRLVDLSIEDVPGDVRMQIEQKLKTRRRPITDATILDVYLELQVR
jgi:hypothetical protein